MYELPSYHRKNGPPPEGLLEGKPEAIEKAEKLITRGHPYKFEAPRNAARFFGIYFCMTGLHGIHVLIGMVVIGIMMYMNGKGKFTKDYWTPIDLTGLYWHIVDLIWIFLFPLLYLIH